MAVPVRAELIADLLGAERRLIGASSRLVSDRRIRIEGLGRGLPTRDSILAVPAQRLDSTAERLGATVAALVTNRQHTVATLASTLRHPRDLLADLAGRARAEERLLQAAWKTVFGRALDRHRGVSGRLSVHAAERAAADGRRSLDGLAPRLERLARRRADDERRRLGQLGGLLESYSFRRVLERGYAVVRDASGAAVTAAAATAPGQDVSIEFRDGRVGAVIAGRPAAGKRGAARRGGKDDDKQGSLL